MKLEHMPVMHGKLIKSIPMRLLEPFAAQAERNHGGQTLQRLAERGGMDPTELMMIIKGLAWGSVKPSPVDEETLIAWVDSVGSNNSAG